MEEMVMYSWLIVKNLNLKVTYASIWIKYSSNRNWTNHNCGIGPNLIFTDLLPVVRTVWEASLAAQVSKFLLCCRWGNRNWHQHQAATSCRWRISPYFPDIFPLYSWNMWHHAALRWCKHNVNKYNNNVRSSCGPGNAHFISIRHMSLLATCRFVVFW